MTTNKEIIEKYHLLDGKVSKIDLESALDEVKLEQFRRDTDERVQSINEAKLEIIKQVRDFLDAIVKATDNFNK